ncbi:MAG: anti-sigma factor [Acidobacteria bacterium]|nr:anti-sigma factor [Acidobacteriota bacterium]MCL5286603.1 anti-sigma factor [Acidobacteriota bacterium]
MWAAAVVALLFFALNLWQAQKLQRQVSELRLQMRLEQSRKATLEAQQREMEQIRALLAAPETRAVQVKPVSAKSPSFKIFWNEGIGVLVTAQNVPAIPAGHVLQLWIVPKKGRPISAGVFRPEANGSVLKLTRPDAPIRIGEAASLTMTLEPVGGSPQPTSTPSWVGRIR